MNEFYRVIDGGSGSWAITDEEDVLFLDSTSGRWSLSAHSARQVRGWAAVGLLRKAGALPFTPVLLPVG